MFEVKVDKTLCIVVALLYEFGVWRKDEEPYRRWIFRRTLFILQYISFLIYILTLAFRSDDDDEKLFLINVAIGIFVVIVKMFYLLFKKDEILTFFEDPIVAHCITNNDDAIEVNDKIKVFGKLSQVYLSVILLATIAVTFSPLPIFSGQKMLPFFVRFDSESEFDTILYYVSYVFVSFGAFASFVFNWMTLFIWYIMFNYSIEYKLVGNRFQRLGGPTYERDLIDLILSHKNLSW